MPVNTPLSAITDTAIAMLPSYDYNNWTQIVQTYTDYFFFRSFLKRQKVVKQGGLDIRWQLLHDESNNASTIGIASTVNVDMPSSGKQCTAPWIRTAEHTMIDVQETMHLRSGVQIYDYLQARRQIDHLAHIKLIEQMFVGIPTTTTDGDTAARGLPYWVPVNSTTGFNGGAPTGHTTVAGQNPSVVTRWNPYTAQYTAVTYADLLTKMRVAADETLFEAPEGMTNSNENPRRLILTTRAVRRSMEDVARGQNTDVGPDLAYYDGKALFRRNPVISVPILETLTGERVYMLDTDTWEVPVLAGADMVKMDPWMAPAKPTTKIASYLFVWQIICKNRRANAVLATSAASNGT